MIGRDGNKPHRFGFDNSYHVDKISLLFCRISQKRIFHHLQHHLTLTANIIRSTMTMIDLRLRTAKSKGTSDMKVVFGSHENTVSVVN